MAPLPVVCWIARENGVKNPMGNDLSLRLAVFDLDGTLTSVRSPYDYVHRALGVKVEAAKIFSRYRRGELSYVEWGRAEIGLWRSLPMKRVTAITRAIPYWPGAVEFVRRLKTTGVVVAIVSAGFDLHVEFRARELDADAVFCNRLGVVDGRLTGEFVGGVDGDNKGELVRALQARFGFSRDETLTAGDTLADTHMFPHAAVSIAVAPGEAAVAEASDLLLPDGDWSRVQELIEALRPGWLPGGPSPGGGSNPR
jgi:phosphoserine phosphatase